MTRQERFRTLAILLGELVRIPEYDAQATRLYQRLRNGREDRSLEEGAGPLLATARKARLA